MFGRARWCRLIALLLAGFVLQRAAADESLLVEVRTAAAEIESTATSVERDGTLLRVLFGAASDDDRRRVREAAMRVDALALAASTRIMKGINDSDVAAMKNGSGVLSDAQRTELVRLRASFLATRQAQAACHLAFTAVDADERERRARQSISFIGEGEPATGWARVERWLVPALAAYAASEFASARGLFEDAARALAESGELDVLLPVHGPVIALGYASCLHRERGPIAAREALIRSLAEAPFLVDGRRRFALDLAAAEVGFRIDSTGPKGDEKTWERAFGWFIGMSAHAYPALSPVDAMGVLEGRMAGHGRDLAPEILPEIVLVSVMAVGPARGQDELDRRRALAHLAENGRSALVRHEARWHLALQRIESGEQASALEDLALLADERSGAVRRAGALSVGAALAASVVTGASPGDRAWRACVAMLALVDRETGPGEPADAWRVELIRARLLDPSGYDIDSLDRIASSMGEGGASRGRAFVLLGIALRAEEESLIAARAGALLRYSDEVLASLRSESDQESLMRHIARVWRVESLLAMSRVRLAVEQSDAMMRSPDLGRVPVSMRVAGSFRRIGALRAAAEYSAAVDEARSELEVLDDDGAQRLATLLARDGFENLERHATFYPFVEGSYGGSVQDAMLLELCDEITGIDDARLAWALLLAGRAPEARSRFEALSASLTAPAIVVRGWAESLFSTGDAEGAFVAYRRIATSHGDSRRYDIEYFMAWTRMLEILVSRRDDDATAARVGEEARRLLAMDEAQEQPESVIRRLDPLAASLR